MNGTELGKSFNKSKRGEQLSPSEQQWLEDGLNNLDEFFEEIAFPFPIEKNAAPDDEAYCWWTEPHGYYPAPWR